MTEATLKVRDMTCGHCKAAVESELNKLAGVEHSNADIEQGLVEVRYNEARVTPEDLEGAVEEAGYCVVA